MWPFSSAGSNKRDLVELAELKQAFAELEQRFKVIEREHEDLHRAYRRLRASGAAEAREAPGKPRAAHPGGDGADIPAAMTKDELRKKWLTPGFAQSLRSKEQPE